MSLIVPIRVGATTGGQTQVSGQLDGPAGRSVTLQAIPDKGYQFSHWQVNVKPTQLYSFALVSDQPTQFIDDVCVAGGKGQYSAVARELYTDGQLLYLDLNKTPAPTGYWGAGADQYYYYDGISLPVLQSCTGGTTVGSGGGRTTNPDDDDQVLISGQDTGLSTTKNTGDIEI